MVLTGLRGVAIPLNPHFFWFVARTTFQVWRIWWQNSRPARIGISLLKSGSRSPNMSFLLVTSPDCPYISYCELKFVEEEMLIIVRQFRKTAKLYRTLDQIQNSFPVRFPGVRLGQPGQGIKATKSGSSLREIQVFQILLCIYPLVMTKAWLLKMAI